MPKNRSNEPYRVYVLWGLNLAITPIWPDSTSIVLMPQKKGYENSLVVQDGYTHKEFYFLCTSCGFLLDLPFASLVFVLCCVSQKCSVFSLVGSFFS